MPAQEPLIARRLFRAGITLHLLVSLAGLVALGLLHGQEWNQALSGAPWTLGSLMSFGMLSSMWLIWHWLVRQERRGRSGFLRLLLQGLIANPMTLSVWITWLVYAGCAADAVFGGPILPSLLVASLIVGWRVRRAEPLPVMRLLAR